MSLKLYRKPVFILVPFPGRYIYWTLFPLKILLLVSSFKIILIICDHLTFEINQRFANFRKYSNIPLSCFYSHSHHLRLSMKTTWCKREILFSTTFLKLMQTSKREYLYLYLWTLFIFPKMRSYSFSTIP